VRAGAAGEATSALFVVALLAVLVAVLVAVLAAALVAALVAVVLVFVAVVACGSSRGCAGSFGGPCSFSWLRSASSSLAMRSSTSPRFGADGAFRRYDR
jgi:hypothetical protein